MWTSLKGKNEATVDENRPVTSNTLQSLRYIKSFTPKTYDINFKSWVRFMFALNEMRAWVYFNNGKYQVWDLNNDRIECEASLSTKEEDLFIRNPTLLYEDARKEAIAYVVDEPGRLSVLDINNDESLRDYIHEVPTVYAVPMHERNNKNNTQAVLENFELITLPQSHVVALLERLPPGQTSNTYIVTLFRRGANSHPHLRIETKAHKQTWLNRTNKSNTLILWGQSYNNTPFHFWLIQYVENGDSPSIHSKEVRLRERMNAEVINLFPWKENQFVFFYNRNDSGRPRYAIVDLRDGDPTKVFEHHFSIKYEKSRESNLTETYYVHGEDGIIIFEEMTENGINTNIIQHHEDSSKIKLLNRFVNDENLKVEPHSFGVSPDGKLLLEYSENFDINDPMDDDTKTWKLSFNEVRMAIDSYRSARIKRRKYTVFRYLKCSNFYNTYEPTVFVDIMKLLFDAPSPSLKTKQWYTLESDASTVK
eukprot:TRINITY_DN1270_c0_g1_i1.p1 TRINITY_DN1270_c0_g1~~TRINITY_DN1270_c0_g1_i1.p1  ORF type:complete len:479 (+),score=56.26 TRINITY_DN1270_c0_g1_i1:170-1606(+)